MCQQTAVSGDGVVAGEDRVASAQWRGDREFSWQLGEAGVLFVYVLDYTGWGDRTLWVTGRIAAEVG